MATSPIIVIRRRRRSADDERRHGAWKIAYADFMTSIMTFFLVMWLIHLVPAEKLIGIAEYFRDPLQSAAQGGNQRSLSPSLINGGGRDMLYQQGVTRGSNADRRQRTFEQRRMIEIGQRLNEVIDASPLLRLYRPQIRIDITSDGLRLQIVDSKNRPMFDLGSDRLRPSMVQILRAIAPVIDQMPNKISISGHTDAHAYAGGLQGYSNWELSTDRANASRRVLVAGGLDDDKIMRVIGMGSSMPIVKDNPMADINRRISLVILNAAAQRRIEAENAAAADAVPVHGPNDLLPAGSATGSATTK